MVPVARRTIGDEHVCTLGMRTIYAQTLYSDPAATLDDLREAVTALEDLQPTARRVFGGSHPLVQAVEQFLRESRAALRARETPDA